jgi:hypothetical protein
MGRIAAPMTEQDRDAKNRIKSPLRNVRDYLYHRADTLTGTYNVQWKMGQNKPVIMTQLGDQFMIGKLVVYSVPALWEMKRLVRDGMSIEGDGSAKDDRPVALAMGVRCWIDYERQEMDAQGKSFEKETEKDIAMGDSDTPGFMAYIMGQRHAEREKRQRDASRAARKTNWNWVVLLAMIAAGNWLC